MCLLVRVSMVYKNRAVVCCLLATSAIMLSEKEKRKRKMWSKKCYLNRNISCDAQLLNGLLETDVPWDGAIVVSVGKLRRLWDSLSELRSSLWRTIGKDSSEACYIACQNSVVCSVFPLGMTSHSKIAHFNWEYQYQKKWLQHVQRMDTNRLPKQALRYKPKGRRNIGRPRKRWRDQLHLEDQGTGNMPNSSGTWWWWWWWWWWWQFLCQHNKMTAEEYNVGYFLTY